MKKMLRVACASVMALSLTLNVVLLLGGSASAEGVGKVGVVDVARVTDRLKQSPGWQTMMAQFEDRRAEFRNEMQRLTKLRYLTGEERTEVRRLRALDTPTKDDRRRIEELEARSAKLDQEFQRLASLEQPSERQRRRLQEIQRIRERSLEALKDRDQERAQQLAQVEADLLGAEQRKVEEAAAKVARDRQLDLIVDRQFVLFGGRDATDDVLSQLSVK